MRTGKFKIIADYIIADNKRNQRSFVIGTSTVLVIVLFLTFLQNALLRANVIFVRLAEDSVGAFDFLVTADASSPNATAFLNYTEFKGAVDTMPDTLTGSCPRWLLRINVSATTTTNQPDSQSQDIEDSGQSLGQNASVASLLKSAVVLVVNSTKERQIGLSRLWPLRTLGNGECHVSSSLLRALSVRPEHGEQLTLSVNLLQAAVGFGGGSGATGSSRPLITDDSDANSTDSSQPGANQPTGQNGLLPAIVQVPESQLDGIPAPQRELLLTSLNATVVNGTIVVKTSNLVAFLNQNNILNPTVQCSVIGAIDETYGVYPPSLGNVVYIEQKFAETVIAQQLALLSPPLSVLTSGAFSTNLSETFNLEDYTMAAVFMLKDRFNIYSLGADERKAALILASNAVMRRLGVQYPISMNAILNQTLAASLFIQIFLNEIFFTVLVVLVVLAIILISSLLTSDAEEKTFEYGMLRMLGFHSSNLVILLIAQSLVFSIPGVVLGLLMCYILYLPVGYYLANVVGSVVDVSFTPLALSLGILAGLVLPVFGTVFPIRNALSSTIRDALNMYHNSVFDSSLSIKRLENVGLSVNQTAIAIVLVVVGFLVYYLIPLSFIFGRLDLFFRIMTIILLGMVFGMVLISQVVEPYVSRLAVEVTTYLGWDHAITAVVVKNMYAHASRNRKTSVMFTLCLGYIVFVSTMFSLQIRSLSQSVEWFMGADVVINGPQFSSPLPETDLKSYLSTLISIPYSDNNIDRIVIDFTFVSYPINQFSAVRSINIGRLAAIRRPSVQLYGIQRNFLQVALNEYANPTQLNQIDYQFNYSINGAADFVEQLFVNTTNEVAIIPPLILTNAVRKDSGTFGTNRSAAYQSHIPILISEAARDSANIYADSRVLMQVAANGDGSKTRSYITVPVAMLKKLPAFPTINRLVRSNMPTLVSMDQYERILNDIATASGISVLSKSSAPVPKGQCLIKLRENTTVLQVQSFINQLNSLLSNDAVTVLDLRTQIQNTQTAAQLIEIVFNIVAIVGVLLSFFVLLLSFTANVRENSWQLGVLRAIGLTEVTVTKIFIYEALSIVIACTILGVLLGVVTAITLTLQSNLFSELPFAFQFPVGLFMITLVFSFVLATLGSYFPIAEFNKKPISNALKGQ